MSSLKIEILQILAKHKNRWLKTKAIGKELNLNTTADINLISNILYRSRHIPHIERKRNSHAYQYRYCEEIKGHPTLENPYPKIESDKKARGDSDKFNGFSFVEPLAEITEGYCEHCESYTQIAFKAEKGGSIVLLCEKHGKAIDKMLCEYGSVFA